MAKEDIDEFILMGGSTRIPKIQQLVKEPSRGISTVETMAKGSAIQACILSGGYCDDRECSLGGKMSYDWTSSLNLLKPH
ncbi:hypothetical protein TCAL_09850 [Tigriopus californicus]|uniref:Uncharacterized protein n=1 Tax=Tigriopus californicus TaxID=6832 RepID=A0A553PDH4_TIGCA|nr:hypothetical protein TCAL_09850 [Tigriopus californicus]|eukprot:TCALIF_09850-PA protein Name:"Similar to hspa5 78 kDa glucose-regulated protein (Xenopus laevis)" AED:0.58 eAED:0.58 QI:0/-1/0/1/-1/1/1/0/79